MKNPLAEVTAEAWLDDAAEALGVGLAIGERVLLMGTSTGATLALTLLDSPQGERISALVLLAPNFGPADSNSEFLTWPAGTTLARLVIGSHHSWEPANQLQKRYWATSYPVEALVEMMRLVKRVREQQPIRTQAALLAVYSPHDTVINTAKLVEGFGQIEAPRKRLLALPDADDPANPGMHVLAGDIMAPHNTTVLADTIIAFVSQAAR
jgi:pimeloyl-ACP methyl ester carboxylesterase